jgi:two-component system, response regulator PdtaR
MTSSRPAALIVEDQPFVGMVTSDILRETGFDTFHAYDAKDALELLRQHPEIEVVVTERDLPGDVDGIELSRRVASERPAAQLVVVSKDRGDPLAGLPRGARVLRKPYASADLRMLVCAATMLQEA